MKNKLSKLYKIFLAVGMVFSMCFNTLGMSVVNAYDPSVPKEFTRVKNIKYPEWWGRKIPSIASWSTYSCKYDGKWAFCLEAEKKTPKYDKDFETFWAAYPRKADKGQCYKKYKARIKDGYSPEELLTAATNYAEQCRRQKTEQQYIKHGKTFLGDSVPFADFLPKMNEQPVETKRPETGGNPFRR